MTTKNELLEWINKKEKELSYQPDLDLPRRIIGYRVIRVIPTIIILIILAALLIGKWIK